MPDDATAAADEAQDTGTDTGQQDPAAAAMAEAEKWKALARKHESASKSLSRELSELKNKDLPDAERRVEEAKALARAEALKETALERAGDAAVAAAAGKLTNPEIARRLIELEPLVSDDGSFDRKEIAKAVDQLVKDEPYLAAKGDGRAGGSADQGPRGGGPAPDMNAWLRNAAGR